MMAAMNPTYIPTRIALLRSDISQNRARLREDWQSVESLRISRQNIANAKAEIERLELELGLQRELKQGTP